MTCFWPCAFTIKRSVQTYGLKFIVFLLINSSHSLLINKLKKYGISGIELNWLKSYLSNRMQSVKIGCSLSDLMLIDIGIPQGSILGPLLFILFVNDLPDCVTCKTVMYADDTTLLIRSFLSSK